MLTIADNLEDSLQLFEADNLIINAKRHYMSDYIGFKTLKIRELKKTLHPHYHSCKKMNSSIDWNSDQRKPLK